MNLFRMNSFIFFLTLFQSLLGCIEKKIYFGCIEKKFILVVLKKNSIFSKNLKKNLINTTLNILLDLAFFYKIILYLVFLKIKLRNLSTLN